MTKGGKREASESMPVGKGMGLYQHYKTLDMIYEMGITNIRALMIELNKKFAWWDDPVYGPTETCRSYVKELWRLGMLDRFDKHNNIIELNPENWKRSSIAFSLSPTGKYILKQKRRQFPYFVAHCILKAVENGVYPQCEKLFRLYEQTGSIPINDDKTVIETSKRGFKVEKHAGKTIKFGWLEPTGLIYRKNNNVFVVNDEFKQTIKSAQLNTLFANVRGHIIENDISVILSNPILPDTYFKRGETLTTQICFTNKTDEPVSIKIKPRLSSIFEHTAKLNEYENNITLGPRSQHQITLTLVSESFGYSNSFWVIFCGLLDVIFNNIKRTIYLSTVTIRKEDPAWEARLLKDFSKLGLKTFHLGRSDRPDGVIDISGLTDDPDDRLCYLRDQCKEKMLMETTTGTYTWDKLIKDARDGSEGESKFNRHTTKVLKIKAIGQVIAASKFDQTIMDASESVSDLNELLNSPKHIVTLIDHETLKYLISKKNEIDTKNQIVEKLLKQGGMLTKEIISIAFEES